MQSTLTPLQRDLLAGFFRREGRFFLTGGAALAGFYLGHRDTRDLDLFVSEDILDAGDLALQETVKELGGTMEKIQTSSSFRRRLVRRGDEAVVVDLVYDETPQGPKDKPVHAGIRLDPPDEILANKLCALLSRGEIRDLVDVAALEDAGYRLEDALELAARKDAGLTPAQLAWVLSQIVIGSDAEPPGGFTVERLRAAVDDWQKRLARLAYPG